MFLDDEPGIHTGLVEIFALRGYETYGAANDKQALDIFHNHKPDICIIDITLPESSLDGIQVIEEFRITNKDIICLIYTSSPSTNYINRINHMGNLNIFKYLTKPIDPDELKAAINLAADQVRAKSNGQ